MRQFILLLLTLLSLWLIIVQLKQKIESTCVSISDLAHSLESTHTVADQISELNSISPKIQTEILILIITAPGNREFRNQLRNESYLTYPWVYQKRPSYKVNYAFVVGWPGDSVARETLKDEAATENDLLIGDFEDTYENLVYKTIWLLRYAVERYSFEFVMKVDDDTFINQKLLFDFLFTYIKPKYTDNGLPYYGGMIRKGPRDVLREGQWGIEKWEYAEDYFAPYLVGGAYIMNTKAARAIINFNSVNKVVAFRIEDAFVGALADRLGIKPADIPKTYSKQYDRFCGDKNAKIFHRVAPSFQVKMIYNWTAHGYYCTQPKSHEQIIADGEEFLRKY